MKKKLKIKTDADTLCEIMNTIEEVSCSISSRFDTIEKLSEDFICQARRLDECWNNLRELHFVLSEKLQDTK